MAACRGSLFVVPTLECVYAIAKDLPGNVPQHMQEVIGGILEGLKKNLIKVYRAGIPMAWGTDADRITFNAYPGIEFLARKECGFTNEELLKMATIDSAKCAGLGRNAGTVEAGKLADLIVMDGDPLADIEVMTKMPVHVFKEGKRVAF